MTSNILYKIEWHDSRLPSNAWDWISNIQKPTVIECITVGFLVRSGKGVKSFAQTIADDGQQALGIIEIPTRAITKMTRIK